MLRNHRFYFIFHYVLYLVVSFLVISLCWSFIALGKYFVCTDPIPIANFFPPFVHGVRIGDYFTQGKSVAYEIWYFLIAGIFLLPITTLYIQKIKKWTKGKALLFHSMFSLAYAYLVLYALWILILVTIIAVPLFVLVAGVYWYKKKLNTLLSGICALFLAVSMALIGYGFNQSSSAPREPLFPLDDPHATYIIQKLGDSYAIIYVKHGVEERYAFVGNSTTELEQYRGLSVHISSDYTHSSKEYPYGNKYSNIQCIQHVCHEIFPPHFGESVNTAVIDINGIDIKK